MKNKKLYRSTEDKVIFGVCGGLGDYFDIDAVIIRIVFVLLTVWGGSGILVYIILAIVVPEKSNGKKKVKNETEKKEKEIEENVEKLAKDAERLAEKHSDKGNMVFGLILLFVGISLLAGNFFPIFDIWKLWPLILIVLALVILAKGSKEK